MSLRIAIAGKGGTGKTTVAALLCRSLLARNVKPLLAVDADPNSCLPEKLGVAPDRTIGQLREDLRAEPDKVPAGISKSEWIERLINQEVAESTGVDLIVMGRQEGPDCYCYINNLLRQCLEKISGQYEALVIDNEAGLEHLSRRSNGGVDVLLVVCEATMIGARTAARITELVRDLGIDVGYMALVLNRHSGEMPPGLAAAFDSTGLEVAARIPDDPAVVESELKLQPLMVLGDESPAAAAVNKLAGALLERRSS